MEERPAKEFIFSTAEGYRPGTLLKITYITGSLKNFAETLSHVSFYVRVLGTAIFKEHLSLTAFGFSCFEKKIIFFKYKS